ncbi:IclR family transcriptional regulator [Actinomadura sp. KC216]|uniref:IclR family transcriptional regulator n=1 Tax=Actinomadura sp. KC216 TaxID=2530370 RepID=UPI001049CCC0|nr:IclR family transcriptional regulator [Actinomadura sp. KC216]TDB85918.1 IclR family transcriptional regulator [Actinomadura sp. KC216]
MTSRGDADEGAAARPRVQSAARTVAILLAVARSDRGLTTKEISEQVGVGRQTVYHLLHTLTETGMLARGGDGRIILGLNVGSLVAGFDRQLSPSERLAPLVRRLAQETDETSYAAGWHLGEITVHAVSRGSNPVQAAETPLGFTGLAHARASGKMLLAMMPADERARYLASHPLDPVTARTIVDAGAFEKEMELVRERGYATDREELAEGVCCAAVPLDGGRSPYVLAVSAPKSRFEENFDRNLAILRKIAEVSFIELLKS